MIGGKLTCARFENQATYSLADTFDEASGAFFLNSAKWLGNQS
jgi:hypothetical protein